MKVDVANNGNWVEVHYEGTLDDGSVFDSSKDREPLKFKLGSGMVIPGFDKGVIGMKVKDSKQVKIKAEDAYGARNEQVLDLPKTMFNDISMLEAGKEITAMSNQGPVQINVVAVEKESVKAILNHPMAGKNLNFKITLERVLSEKEAKELDESMSHGCCGGEGCSNEEGCSNNCGCNH